MSKHTPQTARHYVLNSDTCPVCGSGNVSWQDISVEGAGTYQDAACDDCDARFYTVSRLVGYGLIPDGQPPIVATIPEDSGEFDEAFARTIRVDYPLLDRQIKRLGALIRPYEELTTADEVEANEDYEGMYELLCRIYETQCLPSAGESEE